jgi:hypothetical protein
LDLKCRTRAIFLENKVVSVTVFRLPVWRPRGFQRCHIFAIAASVVRAKDKARIEQMLAQAGLDKSRLENVLQSYNLKLPTL